MRCTPALKISFISWSVRNSRLPNLAGRSSGVKLRLVQYPCRSGWPSASRGMTDDFASAGFASLLALAFAVLFSDGADWVCAGAVRGANKTIESAMAKALDENRRRVVIWTPLGELFSFRGAGWICQTTNAASTSTLSAATMGAAKHEPNIHQFLLRACDRAIRWGCSATCRRCRLEWPLSERR